MKQLVCISLSIFCLAWVSPAQTRTVDPAELTLSYFHARQSNAGDLYKAASRVLSSRLIDKGSKADLGPNMVLFGSAIMLHDTAQGIEILKRGLKVFDEASLPEAKGGVAGVREPLIVEELRPEHLSADDLMSALAVFSRGINFAEGGSQTMIPNISLVRKREIVLVRDTASNIRKIKELVSRIDVPRPEVVLTFQILRPLRDGEIPEKGEVVKQNIDRIVKQNLALLLPYTDFKLAGTGLLRLTVGQTEFTNLTMKTSVGDCHIKLKTGAFSSKKKRLAIEEFGFQLSKGEMIPQQFKTKVAVQEGEFAVVGAFDMEPIFVVVKLTVI